MKSREYFQLLGSGALVMMIDAHDLPSIQLVHKGYVTSHGQLPGSMWPFKLLARTWGVVSY